MRKYLMLLVILLLLTITGCKTIYVYPEYELPVEPQREILEQPETIQDLGLIINYYDSLVYEWELWADTTKRIIEVKK